MQRFYHHKTARQWMNLKGIPIKDAPKYEINMHVQSDLWTQ